MKSRQWVVTIGLFTLVLATVIASILTRDLSGPETTQGPHHRTPLVDETPLDTAHAMAKLASSSDQLRFAYEALRLGDQEVDLAFADALRDAANHPPQPTPENKELYARVSSAEAALKADQDRVDQLKKSMAAAHATHLDDLQNQLDVTQAQLELDQDELDGAKADLARSGADPLSRIQRQFKRHEAAEHGNETNTAAAATPPINYQAGNLFAQFTAWRALRNKAFQLKQAGDDAGQLATTLERSHDTLNAQISAEKTNKAQPAQSAEGQTAGPQPLAAPNGTQAKAAAIRSLHRLSDDQKDLADLNKRIQDEQELQTTYGNWLALVRSHERAALHGMVQSTLWILLIVLAVYVVDRVIDHRLVGNGSERSRLHTLRVILRFAVQAVGALLMLIVVLGVPQQTPTILGFAGAGLTVALKDFIVAFVGWFVLMGKNGIRVGDWVEINGVAGEVIEIDLLRTVLLETGNWTDTGHPTGRKVSFVNNYAIEGHFFNFTTSGQWLWDELQILVPPEQDAYALLDAVQEAVVKETEANTRAAAEEWQHASRRYRVRSVSPTPAVTLRPTSSGVEVHIRYITRAHERHATRSRVYQAVVQLLRRKGVAMKETAAT